MRLCKVLIVLRDCSNRSNFRRALALIPELNVQKLSQLYLSKKLNLNPTCMQVVADRDGNILNSSLFIATIHQQLGHSLEPQL